MTNTGKLIIFTMDIFEDSNLHNLPGNEKDVAILQDTFRHFNADVDCVYRNFTRDQIKNKMKEVEREDFSTNKYLVVAILTHGGRKETLYAYDRIFDLERTVIFPIQHNKSLNNKPKCFLIDACKGSFDLENDMRFNDDGFYPRKTIKFFSTTEGLRAYGTDDDGSFFIQTLCRNLKNYGTEKNLKEIMEQSVDDVERESGGRQLPTLSHNLTTQDANDFILGKM